MREISLTRGLVALVDDEDYEFLAQWKWAAKQSGPRWYAYRMKRVVVGVKQQCIHMHRLLLNAPVSMDVDHADSNGLNNTRSNLRVCTRSQNFANRRGDPCRGVPKGVTYRPRRTMHYEARIKKDSKTYYLGAYSTSEEAAIAYMNKAVELFGEFARAS